MIEITNLRPGSVGIDLQPPLEPMRSRSQHATRTAEVLSYTIRLCSARGVGDPDSALPDRKRFLKVVGVTSEAHWHEVRAKNVGVSAVATLFGKSPYTTRYMLWHVKNGSLPAEESRSCLLEAGEVDGVAVHVFGEDLNVLATFLRKGSKR